MNPWFGRAAVIASLLLYILIRWPHGNRSRTARIAENHHGSVEIFLLILAALGTTLVPLGWALTGFPANAAYPLHQFPFVLGVVATAGGLWLFHRSHVDLGTNWSVTLQVREEHRLVTEGVFRRIRHPMYAAMFLIGTGHALFIPNWIAGPAYLVSFTVLYLGRIGNEERMMRERFGAEYDAYARRTGRLMPRFRRVAAE